MPSRAENGTPPPAAPPSRPSFYMKHHTRSYLRALAGLTLALSLLSPSAFAANLIWDTTSAADATITDGAGTWNVGAATNGGGWNTGSTSVSTSFTAGDNVTFGSGAALAANYTVALGSTPMTVGSITFNNPNPASGTTFGYTIGSSGQAINVGTIFVTPASSWNNLISAAVNGDFTVTSSGGGGTVALAGNGTQTSANTVTISANTTLQLGNNFNTGSVGSASIVINNGGTLKFRRSNASFSIANAISGSGQVQYQLGGITATLAQAGTYTGATTLTGTSASAGTYSLKLGVSDAISTNSSGLTLTGLTGTTGTLDLNGFNQTVKSLTGTFTTLASEINVGNTAVAASTFTINGSTNTTYAGLITGNLSLVKSGTSKQTLSGTNTFTGATLVNAGTLATSTSGTFGAGDVTVASGAALTFGNAASIGDLAKLTFAGTSTAGSISLSFTGTETVGSVFNSISGTYLAAGTGYTATQLNGLFTGNAIFTGSGLLTIASAIPEPSTYAALAGLGMLGFAAYRRRRAAR